MTNEERILLEKAKRGSAKLRRILRDARDAGNLLVRRKVIRKLVAADIAAHSGRK